MFHCLDDESVLVVQIGLKMEPGDCPPLNINAMRAISVKSFLKTADLWFYCT